MLLAPQLRNGSAYGDRTRFSHFVMLRDFYATFRDSARYCDLSKITTSHNRAELRSFCVRICPKMVRAANSQAHPDRTLLPVRCPCRCSLRKAEPYMGPASMSQLSLIPYCQLAPIPPH